jgi:IS5 family transposase
MKQIRKGGSWHFGMKPHIGTDPRGIVHSVTRMTEGWFLARAGRD